MKTLSILTLILLPGLHSLYAQTNYTINNLATVSVEGTSTMHDWTMETAKVTGKAGFILNGDEITGIRSLSVTIPAESLKSGKGAMDKNAYKALKTDDHKEIGFILGKVNKIEKSGDKFILTTEGKLTIAGATKNVQLTATALPKSNGDLQCTGSTTIKMTDYQVEPPSFMFGSVKTGDQITIAFDVTFSRSLNQ